MEYCNSAVYDLVHGHRDTVAGRLCWKQIGNQKAHDRSTFSFLSAEEFDTAMLAMSGFAFAAEESCRLWQWPLGAEESTPILSQASMAMKAQGNAAARAGTHLHMCIYGRY